MSFETDLAHYVGRVIDDGLTPDADASVRLILLDTIAIGMGAIAHSMPSVDIVRKWSQDSFAPGSREHQASVWGGGQSTPTSVAALVNGTAAEVLDFQEVLIHGRNNGHAAVVIAPALMALAEANGVAFHRLRAAIGAALEVNLAILIALGRSHRTEGRGIRTTSLAAPVAAALAGAVMVGMEPRRAINAMGIAGGALPIGLLAAMAPDNRDFSMDKDLSVGLSAAHAVTATELALAGMTGPSTVVTGARGMLATYSTDPDTDFRLPTSGTPNLWRYALKRFASNFGTQAAVAACLDLGERLPAEAIERVVVKVKTSSAQSLSTRDITNHVGARFSLPYVVASTLVRYRCVLADFDGDALADPTVLELMERVVVEGDEALEDLHLREGHFPAEVTLTTADGQTCQKAVTDIWQGVSPDGKVKAIAGKVHDLLEPAGLGDHIDKLIQSVIQNDDLNELSALIGKPFGHRLAH